MTTLPQISLTRKHHPAQMSKPSRLQGALTEEQLRLAARMARHLEFSCLADEQEGLSIQQSLDKKRDKLKNAISRNLQGK